MDLEFFRVQILAFSFPFSRAVSLLIELPKQDYASLTNSVRQQDLIIQLISNNFRFQILSVGSHVSLMLPSQHALLCLKQGPKLKGICCESNLKLCIALSFHCHSNSGVPKG
jgi:hypothetical protein